MLGIVYLEFDWNWPAAEREMRIALELNPSSTAHLYYAEYLSRLGRRDEAIAEIERARSVDPFSLRVMSEGVFWEFIARNYDRAIQAGRAALTSEPNNAPLYSYLALIYALQKRNLEAIDRAIAVPERGETTHHLFARSRTLRIRHLHGFGFSVIYSISPHPAAMNYG